MINDLNAFLLNFLFLFFFKGKMKDSYKKYLYNKQEIIGKKPNLKARKIKAYPSG